MTMVEVVGLSLSTFTALVALVVSITFGSRTRGFMDVMRLRDSLDRELRETRDHLQNDIERRLAAFAPELRAERTRIELALPHGPVARTTTDVLMHLPLTATAVREDDGRWFASIDQIRGVFEYGPTEETAIRLAKATALRHLAGVLSDIDIAHEGLLPSTILQSRNAAA